MVLLEIYRSLQQWKNFANRSRIDKVIAMVMVTQFFWLTVYKPPCSHIHNGASRHANAISLPFLPPIPFLLLLPPLIREYQSTCTYRSAQNLIDSSLSQGPSVPKILWQFYRNFLSYHASRQTKQQTNRSKNITSLAEVATDEMANRRGVVLSIHSTRILAGIIAIA